MTTEPRTGRELPEDLRHLPPADDGFQIVPADLALILLGMLAIYCLLLWPLFWPALQP